MPKIPKTTEAPMNTRVAIFCIAIWYQTFFCKEVKFSYIYSRPTEDAQSRFQFLGLGSIFRLEQTERVKSESKA